MDVYYKIHHVSAQAVLGYAAAEEGERFSFRLNASATKKCVLPGPELQEDNALFFQIMCVLRGDDFSYGLEKTVFTELADVIFYMDFSGVFDAGQSRRSQERRKKAESLFRPEGVSLDFGSGPRSYVAFERSGSMSRQAKLSFIRADLYDTVRRRIMLDMEIETCQLSKLYAYNGLMLSGGTRIDGLNLQRRERVVVVDNPEFVSLAKVITVKGGEIRNGQRSYERVEDGTEREISIKGFDGEGLISKNFSRKIDKLLCGKHIHRSYQIRLPFIKGMLHEVDFQELLLSSGGTTITDIWGNKHRVGLVDIILTKSMFKGYDWLTENGMDWQDYWRAFVKYRHALYISGVGKPKPEKVTQLNYQFLTTLSMTAEEFRPADLPLGWERSPSRDKRRWITKATEQRYFDLCQDEKKRLAVFTERDDDRAKVLKKNPLFLNEPVFTRQLENMAKRVLEDYAIGHLLVDGDVRYLSADLMEFLAGLPVDYTIRKKKDKNFHDSLTTRRFANKYYYAPKAAYKSEGVCTILRNPHIARNEEIRLENYNAKKEKDNMRNWYLGKLSDVLMVDTRMLAAERLGGADYDGDMVKTIADPIVRQCVERNYSAGFENANNLPLLLIPSEEPVLRDANDWHDRYITVRDTFSSRVGQICNAAFDRSVIAYDENSDAEERERRRQETETLAILVGLEIDSAKSGVKPNLDAFLKERTVKRSQFLRYKELLGDSRGTAEKRRKIIEETDWSQVSSNVEKLPYYAAMLRDHTPRLKPVPAKDAELFEFAADPNWKEGLDPGILADVDSLLRDCLACLSRIRACRAPVGNRKRERDIRRVLFARGQEERYDVDELYAAFSRLEQEQSEELCKAVREQKWQLMDREARLDFLSESLPGYEEWYALLADFRAGGYRVLGDLLCDVCEENRATERKRLHRETDSDAFTAMMDAYENRLYARSYREAVASACRKELEKIIDPQRAVRYIVALGRRDLLWDLVPDQIEREAAKGKRP